METVRRCSLYVLSCVVLFTVLSGLFSDKAFAASDYDDTIHTTSSLKLTGYAGDSTPDVDMTSNYMGYFKRIITDNAPSYDCNDTRNGTDSTSPDACNQVIDGSLDHGDWFIYQQHNAYPGEFKTVSGIFCDAKMSTVTGYTTGPSGSYGIVNKSLYVSSASPATCVSMNIQYATYFGNWKYQVSGQIISQAAHTDLFSIGNTYTTSSGTLPPGVPDIAIYSYIFTGNVTYPDGYQGTTPPTNVGNKPTISPQFTYQLSDKKLTATDHNLDLPTFTPDAGYNIVKYQVEWTTFKCGNYDTSHGNTAGSCQSPTLKDHQILDQASDYSYTVDDYAHYQLTAEYLVQECYRYPSYPATPDYCFDVSLGTELPDYLFTSTAHDFDINGQSISGDTASETCDVSGYCQVTAQDCTIQPDTFAIMRCNFNNSLNTGLLNPSLNAFKSLISSLVVPSSPTCGFSLANVNIPGGGVFNFASFGSSVCTRAAQIRTAFPIGPIAINFLLAFLELRLVVGMVNKMLNDKDNDVIVGVNQ